MEFYCKKFFLMAFNRQLAFAICLLPFAFCSEKTTKVATTEKKSTTPIVVKPTEPTPSVVTPKTTEVIVNIPKGIDPNLVLSISRSGCFGKCPAYSFSLTSDGKAVYDGVAYVSKLGKHTTQVPKKDIDKFLLETEHALSLQQFKDKYPIKGELVSDLPTTKTYIRLGNTGKLIANNYDAPKEVLDLETRIENFAEGLKWVKN